MILTRSNTRYALALSGFAATALIASSGWAQTADPFGINPTDTDLSKDEVVLDISDEYSDSEIQEVAAKCGLTVHLNSPSADASNLYIADVAEGGVPSALECLDKHAPADWLEAGEENLEMTMLGGTPNDPLYQFQWNFKQVHAEEAWSKSTGKGVVVAVIDTGVAVEDDPARNIKAVKDLAGTATVKGYDFVDKDAFPWDGHGHGTHVAGTIAQTTGNKYGVAGLAYNAKIMPLRVLNSQGFGQVADIADSIRFAADNGAQVINMSLGGPLPSLVMKKAIDYAHKKGVTIIAAAGNGGRRAPSYPAAYDHVVAVAATQFDQTTTFYSQWGKFVDIAAPGGNTRVDQNGDDRPDGIMQETIKDGKLDQHDFLLYMGTSMASPHVAAGAALVIEQGITNPDKVEEVLRGTADTAQKKRYKNPDEFNERYGAGIMQADAAVTKAATEQGGWRLGFAFLLGLLSFSRLRRKDQLDFAPGSAPMFAMGAVAASSGLFFLPLLVGDLGLLGAITNFIGRPIAEFDFALFGPTWHQTPIMASAAIPLAAAGLLGGTKRFRPLVAGLAIGFGGFLLAESFILTSDVLWIPGVDVLDRLWLAGNGVLATVIGYLTLKRY
jgi:serine protease